MVQRFRMLGRVHVVDDDCLRELSKDDDPPRRHFPKRNQSSIEMGPRHTNSQLGGARVWIRDRVIALREMERDVCKRPGGAHRQRKGFKLMKRSGQPPTRNTRSRKRTRHFLRNFRTAGVRVNHVQSCPGTKKFGRPALEKLI